MLTIVAALVAGAAAHNWPNGPSRVSLDKVSASTLKPTVPSQTGEPQVVVRAGQKFQVEFVTGHGNDVYFILINAKDKDKLVMHELPLMDNFLKDPACPQTPPAAQWANYHYKYDDMSLDFDPGKDTNGNQLPLQPAVYNRIVPKTDANFIPRDKVFKKAMKNMPTNGDYSKIVQFEYKAAELANNRRCIPTTPVKGMTWIVAMHRYRINRHDPSRPDVFWAMVPPGSPAGDYILHYRWRGYYDAIDIQVIDSTTDVQYPFGGGPTTGAPVTRFKRLDHCQFPQNAPAGACVPMTVTAGKLATPDACFTACKNMAITKCNGVAVVPIANPTSVVAAFRSMINIPFNTTNCKTPTDASTHMCWPLLQRDPTATENAYFVSNDFEDPAFYSTCFVRVDSTVRPGLPDPSTLPPIANDVPDWKTVTGKCIPCADQDAFSKPDNTPDWRLANNCVNCDVANQK